MRCLDVSLDSHYLSAMRRGTAHAAAARRQTAAESLLKAAERLFGRLGIDGVSLREIAAAAGHRNVNAVQYHFGDKGGLVRAIYERNLAILDRRRGELLDQLRIESRLDSLPALVRCFFQPLVELVDEDGLHGYAAFHNQALNSPRWSVGQVDWAHVAPVTQLMVGMVGALGAPATESLLSDRFAYATMVILRMLGHMDAHRQQPDSFPFSSANAEEAFQVATRIFGSAASPATSRTRKGVRRGRGEAVSRARSDTESDLQSGGS